MQGSYDLVLVLLSVATAVVASFVALDMASRVAAAIGNARRALLWLGCGALAMGTGIWSMHFVGMLAFSLPVPLAYEVGATLASWLVAVLSSALALHTVSQRQLGWQRLLGAGTLMGVGIAAMHYLGMEAMQMRPRIAYDPWLFGLSVLIAIAASSAALLICFRLRHETVLTGFRKKTASALVMGAAIAGMHYTGMAAANFAPGSVCGVGPNGIGGSWLGFIISGLVALFLVTTLLVSVYGAMPPTIRSRLVFLVVAASLPVSLMAVVVMVHDYQRLREQQARALVVTARAILATVDKDLAGVESGLRVLSTSRSLLDGNLPAFQLQAEDALGHLHVAALVLEDGHGSVLMDIRLPPSAHSTTPSHGPRPASSSFSNAAFLQTRFEKENTVTIAVPVAPGNGGKAPASDQWLRASLWPERLTQLLNNQHLAGDWIVSIYDAEGTILARSHEMRRFVGTKGAPRLLQRLAQVDEDSVDAVTLEGIPVLSAFSRSPATGWAVSIGIPSSSLSTPLLSTVAWLIAGLVLMLTASLLLAWRIGGSIANAVQALTGPALALGSGAPIVVPPLGLTEADKVGNALRQAAHLLDTAKHEAHHDMLTGLANRSLFRQIVQQQLAQAHRNGGNVSILFIDLDGFKAVNDAHGHAVGDALLQQAAQRLLLGVRGGDLVARLGGDEFAVALFQPGLRGTAKVAGMLVESLSSPFLIEGLVLQISASIGGASYGPHAATDLASCEALLQQADSAMYRAKEAGKRRFVMAEPLGTG